MIEQKAVMYPNLVAEMAKRGETYGTLAELLQTSISAVGRRINGTVEWTKSEIDTLCDHYNKSYTDLFGN
jgi:hypothetical protein